MKFVGFSRRQRKNKNLIEEAKLLYEYQNVLFYFVGQMNRAKQNMSHKYIVKNCKNS